MATIKFQDYIIEESLYYSNPEFRQPSSEGELVVEDSFNAEVGINGDGMGYVRIKTSLGNFDDMLNCNIKCIKNFKNLYRQRITQ